MGTVNVYTAERMQAMSDNSIVSASVDDDGNLTFTTRGGQIVSAGNIKGDRGGTGSEPNATTSVEGLIKLATEAEVIAGTNTTKVVTPATIDSTIHAPADTARVTLGSTTAVAANATVQFDSVAFDPNSLWDVTHKQFVVKRAGIYLLTAKIAQSGTASFAIGISKSPTASPGLHSLYAQNTADYSAYMRGLMELNVGDSVKVTALVNGITPSGNALKNWFEIEFRRPL